MTLGVLGAGAVAAIGHSLPEVATSLACRISRFRETHVRGAAGSGIVAAPVLTVTRQLSGAERGMCLATPAVREACAGVRGRFRSVGLVIARRRRQVDGWRGPRTEIFDDLAALDRQWAPFPDRLAELAAEELGAAIPTELRAEVLGEHAAAIAALETARQMLASRALEACLLVGIDSSCEPALLEWLDAARVLSTPGAPPIVFGEAAACLLLAPPTSAPELVAAIAGAAVRQEQSDEEEALGLGLAHCVERVLAPTESDAGPALPAPEVGVVYSDMNGDRRRARLLGRTAVRAGWSQGGRPALVHPADCLGDVGAATGALLLALASEAVARSAGGHSALVVTTSLPFGAMSEALRRQVEQGTVAKERARHAVARVVPAASDGARRAMAGRQRTESDSPVGGERHE